jgi:hypothetical protein
MSISFLLLFDLISQVSEYAKPGTLLMNQHQRLDVFLSNNQEVPFELLSASPEATLVSLAVVCFFRVFWFRSSHS